MTTSALSALRRSLGFTVQEVALMAGWPGARQQALEAGDEMGAEEADRLSALLGADVELLSADAPARPLARLLKGQASALDAVARFSLTGAASVAREIQTLRGRLDLPTGLGIVSDFHANGNYGHPREGVPQQLASSVRGRLGLGAQPVASMRRDILEPLGIVVLWTALPPGIDAVAMAVEETGAVIVANPDGQHMRSAAGRRVAFAHEVCHILFDRPEMHRFDRACRVEGEPVGQQREWFERVERRARAFALALLAPGESVSACWTASGATGGEQLQAVMSRFGIGYQAARSHLHNLNLLDMGAPIQGTPMPSADWERADTTPSGDPPLLRSGELATLAEMAVQRGILSPRRAAELRRGPLSPPVAWTPPPGGGVSYATTSMNVLLPE